VTDPSHADPSDPRYGAEVERPGPVRVPGGVVRDAGSPGDPGALDDPGSGGGQGAGGRQGAEGRQGAQGRQGAEDLVFPTEDRFHLPSEPRRRPLAAAVLGVLALMAALAAAGSYLLSDEGGSVASDGADSPSEALSGLLEAFLDNDAGGAGSMLVPAERAAFHDSGLDLLSELSPLVALDDGSSAADYAGAEITSIGLRMTAEPLFAGVESLSFSLGSLQGSVDIAGLRPAAVLADWLPLSLLAPAGTDASPVVAVRHDGRWYISVWYTLAEHLRTIRNLELPDFSQRPPAIGAPTPGEAAEAVIAELLALDARRFVGMLDPSEAAAVYDYWTLFGASADAIANTLLGDRDAEGWAWAPTSLEYTLDVDDDTAMLTPTLLGISGAGDVSSFELELDAQAARVALSGLDLWGDPVAVEATVTPDGECSLSVGSGEGQASPASRQPSDGGAAAVLQRMCLLDPASPGALVMRRLDDRWYLSPTLSAARGSLEVISLLGLAGMNDVIGSALADAGAPETLSALDLASAAAGAAPDQRARSDGQGLLSPQLGEPDWSYALAGAADVAYEMSLWLSDFGIEADKGVYAYFAMPGAGTAGTAVVVVEAVDDAAADSALAQASAGDASEPAEGFDPAAYWVPSTVGSPVLVAVDGPLFVLVGSLGNGGDAAETRRDAARDLMAVQLQRG